MAGQRTHLTRNGRVLYLLDRHVGNGWKADVSLMKTSITSGKRCINVLAGQPEVPGNLR